MEDLPTPLSRVELYLAKACGMDVTVPEQPLSRLEQFLAILAGDTSITMPTPMSLTEQWLAYVLGVTPDPLLAVEGACLIGAQKVDVRYFAVAASMPGATLPEAPQNRAEMYWAHIAGNPPTPGILKYITGKYFYLTDVVSGIEELQYVKGDTYQQTYSGANLFNVNTITPPTGATINADGSITCVYDNTSGSSTHFMNLYPPNLDLQTSKTYAAFAEIISLSGRGTLAVIGGGSAASQFTNNRTFNLADYHTGDIIKTTDMTKADFSGTNLGTRTYVGVQAGLSLNLTFRMSVIADTTVTPETFVYQPYTGGIPSPNPDYPQPIQVVTGAQTVTATGKNLFDKDNANILVSYFDSSVTTITADSRNRTIFIPCLSNTTYTVSKLASPSPRSIGYTEVIPTNGVQVYGITNIARDGTTGTITTGASAKYLVVRLWSSSQDTNTTLEQMLKSVQVEQGSTATDYQPYQSQSYTIDLGSTELCKIGDYQDYIYKSEEDWYVHKETGKMELDGTESWSNSGNWWGSGRANYGMYCYFTDLAKIGAETTYNHALLCNDFSEPETGLSLRSGVTEGIKQNGGTGQQYIALAVAQTRLADVTSQALTLSSLKNWLSTNKPVVYHTLATPTDTKITDATLISQLDALNSAPLPKPIASIALGATGTNLTPYLTIAYYGSDEE